MTPDLALEIGMPKSIDYERLILGALLTGNAHFPLVAGIIRAEDFFLESHRRIFVQMSELHAEGHPIAIHSVAAELQRKDQLDSCRHGDEGGLSYLAGLIECFPGLTDLDYYCKTVKNKSISRRVIAASRKLIDQCIAGEVPTDILASASEMIRQFEAETAPKVSLRSIQEIAASRDSCSRDSSADLGIRSPWASLNRVIGEFRPGQLITIAGLTGSGKSAAALQITEHAAETQGVGVAIFSLEMSSNEILERWACGRAGIDSKKLECRLLSALEQVELDRAIAGLSRFPVWIDDTTNCTLPAMEAALRRQMAKHRVGLLIVDYLQLMQTVGRKDNRTQEVSDISRGMKLAAREFNIPVIMLGQLNRAAATDGREPQLHHLRESSSIEQDSDKVILLHRHPSTSGGVRPVRFIVAKQRNGQSGKYVDLAFHERSARFEERHGSSNVGE